MSEWVEVQGPDGAFRAYVARPAGAKPKAAVAGIGPAPPNQRRPDFIKEHLA